MEEEEGRADGTQKVRGDGQTERDDPASYPQRLQALTAQSYADLVTLTFDLKTGLRSTCDNFGLS